MANIGEHIKIKNAKNGDGQVAALTKGFDRRERQREADTNNREQQAFASGRGHRGGTFFDGTDHINLWDRGQTELGRALAMDTHINLNVRGLGKFRSFYALWVYLTTKHRTTALRDAPSFQLRQMVRERRETGNLDDAPNVRWIVLNALIDHLMNYPELADALEATGDVPLVSYINMNGQRSAHSQAKWWVACVQYVRTGLSAGMTLDFAFTDCMRETPGTYEEIVAGFRADKSQLGRIERPAPALAPAPRKDRKAKPVKAEPTEVKTAPTTGVQALKADLANGTSYKIISIKDPAVRKEFMWNVIGVNEKTLSDLYKQYGDGDYNNLSQRLYLMIGDDNRVCGVRTSSFDNPFVPVSEEVTVLDGNTYESYIELQEATSPAIARKMLDAGSMLVGPSAELQLRYIDGAYELVRKSNASEFESSGDLDQSLCSDLSVLAERFNVPLPKRARADLTATAEKLGNRMDAAADKQLIEERVKPVFIPQLTTSPVVGGNLVDGIVIDTAALAKMGTPPRRD